MHAAYLFIVSGHFPLKSFRTSNMQPVTFAPSFKHISGSWFPFLHAKYAAVWFAHFFCKCLCEANKTLDVGALSFSDMIFLLNSATKLYYTHTQSQNAITDDSHVHSRSVHVCFQGSTLPSRHSLFTTYKIEKLVNLD